MNVPLFSTPTLCGWRLSEVFSSRHLTTGPMVDRLRLSVARFLGRHGHEVDPQRVVLGASATACAQVLFDSIVNRRVWFNCPTFPGMTQAAYHADKSVVVGGWAPRPGSFLIGTDIGGWGGVEPTDKPHPDLMDRCHSWTYRGEKRALYSFYPTKLVPGAEGGALVAADAEEAEELQCRLNCGLEPFTKGPLRSFTPKYIMGRKGNMTDVAAALNLEALSLAPNYIAEVEERWLMTHAWIQSEGVRCVYQKIPYLLQARMLTDDRAQEHVRRTLHDAGIATALNFEGNDLLTIPAPATHEQREHVVREVAKLKEFFA